MKIIEEIEQANATQIGQVLERYNAETFRECEGNELSVKAKYALPLAQIQEDLRMVYLPMKELDTLVWEDEVGKKYSVLQTIANLELAFEFLANPTRPHTNDIAIPQEESARPERAPEPAREKPKTLRGVRELAKHLGIGTTKASKIAKKEVFPKNVQYRVGKVWIFNVELLDMYRIEHPEVLK